jgi:hypothetical protein
MHIHLPKPLHGWREFVGEVGIIVIGVLIALGAEQAVETWHHREVVRRGEDALRDNFARFVKFKAAIDQEAPCMAARAAELRAIIDQSAELHRLPEVGPIPQPYPLPWQIDTWDAMVASGAAPYLPRDRAILYSRIAMSGVDLYEDATKEWEEWGALRSLAGPARPFGDAEEAKVRDTLARAVHQAALVRFIAAHTVDRIRDTGLLDNAAIAAAAAGGHNDFIAAMCRPIVTVRR